MGQAVAPIDVDEMPDLVRLVRDVRESGKPRILRYAGEEVAVLRPRRPGAKRPLKRTTTEAHFALFRSTAGGWSDVDTDKLLEDIYADREVSDRSPVEL